MTSLCQNSIWWERTQGWLWPISFNIDEWRAITWPILPSTDWDRPVPWWFGCSCYAWMAFNELVPLRFTEIQCTFWTTTCRHSCHMCYRPLDAWSVMFTWSNQDNDSCTGSWRRKCRGETKWQRIWIVHHTLKVVRTLECMESIQVSMFLLTSAYI